MSWPLEVYKKASVKDLVLVSLYELQKESRFEELLATCFNLFPEKFSFQNHKNWPDARKLGRPLRFLREEGLVKGSPEEGFSLTGKGKKESLQTINLFRQKKLKL